MNDIPQTSYIRSSLYYEDVKFYIGIPVFSSIYLNTNNTDALYGMYPKSFFKFREIPKLQTHEVHIDMLSGGFKVKNLFFHIALQEKITAQYSTPKSLRDFLKKQHPLLGENGNFSGLHINAMYYRELSAGVSGKFNDKLSYGFKLKYLMGMAHAEAKVNKLIASVNPDTYLMNISSEIVLRGSGPGYELTDSLYGDRVLRDLRNEDENASKEYYKEKDLSPLEFIFNFDNKGIATDFSLEYQMTPKYRVYGGIVDLGYINWNSGAVTGKQKLPNYIFRGYEYKVGEEIELSDFGDDLKDTLMNSMTMEVNKGGYTKYLNPKTYVGVQRIVNDWLDVGMVIRNEFAPKAIQTMVTFSANGMITNNLEVATSWSILDYEWKNVGLGISYRSGKFQYYIASDNVLGPIVNDVLQNVNLRFGMNLIFRKKKKEEPKCMLCD